MHLISAFLFFGAEGLIMNSERHTMSEELLKELYLRVSIDMLKKSDAEVHFTSSQRCLRRKALMGVCCPCLNFSVCKRTVRQRFPLENKKYQKMGKNYV